MDGKWTYTCCCTDPNKLFSNDWATSWWNLGTSSSLSIERSLTLSRIKFQLSQKAPFFRNFVYMTPGFSRQYDWLCFFYEYSRDSCSTILKFKFDWFAHLLLLQRMYQVSYLFLHRNRSRSFYKLSICPVILIQVCSSPIFTTNVKDTRKLSFLRKFPLGS